MKNLGFYFEIRGIHGHPVVFFAMVKKNRKKPKEICRKLIFENVVIFGFSKPEVLENPSADGVKPQVLENRGIRVQGDPSVLENPGIHGQGY